METTRNGTTVAGIRRGSGCDVRRWSLLAGLLWFALALTLAAPVAAAKPAGSISIGWSGWRTIPGGSVSAMLLASLAATSSGTSAAGSTAAPDTAVAAWPELSLTVIADETLAMGEAEAAMNDIGLRVTDEPSPDRSILFVVPLTYGPIGDFDDRLAEIEGMPHGRAAILMTQTDQVQDPELVALLLDEIKELLTAHGQPDVDAMPVFRDDDPHIDLLLRGLAVSP